jgi:hypothetical protein
MWTRVQTELSDLAAAQSNLNEQIARLAARWLVEQALAAGCQAIALEDLKTLEHRGLGKRNNERCSLALRGKVADYTQQASKEAGLVVITVPARETSRVCPRCNHRFTHLRHPGGVRGHAWARCDNCGFSADRDHAAAENVGQRAIAPTASTLRRKPTSRRGLHSVARTRSRRRERKRLLRNEPRQRRPLTGPPRTTKTPSALSVLGAAAGQAGPAAERLAIPPPIPTADEGHRSAGPGPRLSRQAGSSNEMHAVVSPTRLDGLLNAYRTTLQASPILYRKAPWTSARSRRKKA